MGRMPKVFKHLANTAFIFRINDLAGHRVGCSYTNPTRVG
jgi:hypothetical protein